MDEPRRYSDSRANWGCLAAALFAVPLALAVLIGMSLGDCFEPDCRANDGLHLAIALAVVGGLAALVWVAVNAVAKWRRARLGGDLAARAPVWAFLVLAPLAALGLWALWGVDPIFLL
jgi:hypothetical protein